MSIKENTAHLFKGFSKLNLKERMARLVEMGALRDEDVNFLNSGGIKDTTLADKFIENVIGYFQVPLGVATNFNIDDKDYVIPMAVEETSIIAAVSKSARWIREQGHIKTAIKGDSLIGQIQISRARDPESVTNLINNNKQYLIELANTNVAANMVKRGGGVTDIEVRSIKRQDSYYMIIIHVLVNPMDAMGANIINQICEYLKEPIENITQEKVGVCILSNLNDTKITTATVTLRNIQAKLGEAIAEASYFANCDPYRACTNNKGVLNGIDPILIATGNDWRAVDAGIHAYAVRDGQYRSITTWKYSGKTLTGTLRAPIVVGTVGGVTALHPNAKLSLNMLGVKHANELSRIIAAVGLVQNLGALRALTTEGIIQGHMKLHIANLSLSAGAKEEELPLLQKRLEEILKFSKRITLNIAIEVLNELRSTKKLRTSRQRQEQTV